MKISKLTRCGLFASIALIIYYVESLLPPLVPISGFRLGLSNTVTLAAIYILGRKEAFFILMVRIVLGNIFTGQMMSLVYSLCGGVLSFAVICFIKNMFTQKTIWALGIISAFFHTAGQVVCACVLFSSIAFLYYGYTLVILSVVSGLFTGLCAQYAVKYIPRII